MIESQKLEQHHRANDYIPVGKWDYKGIGIAVGDGGPHEVPLSDKVAMKELRKDFPNGFYETVWTLIIGEKNWAQSTLQFDKYHDQETLGFDHHKKRSARVNAALKQAKRFIDAAGDFNGIR